MHPNPAFRHPDRALHETLIDEVGFGMVFAQTPDGPRVAHTPILSTGDGAVQFHIARANGQLEEPLYDGIVELLTRLADAGWLLGVATGKSDRGLISCLEGHGIRDRFITLQTADRHPSKPDPAMLHAALTEAGVAPADAVMIGDTSFDMEMAQAARVRAIGVAWGYHPPEELIACGAVGVANSWQELEGMIHGRT